MRTRCIVAFPSLPLAQTGAPVCASDAHSTANSAEPAERRYVRTVPRPARFAS